MNKNLVTLEAVHTHTHTGILKNNKQKRGVDDDTSK